MTTTAANTANAFMKKSIAVLMAVLLCIPMTGFEYMAFADEAPSSQASDSAQDSQAQDVEFQNSLAGGGFC
ncbi:MAG: hypothetical protein Q4D92_02290 [Slackia sp.]|nr:hypothetical protein [Slackia sp.]